MNNKHLEETSTNKYGEIFKIIKYINSDNVIIQFKNNGYIKHTTYYYFKNGKVCSPYARRTWGIGYLGEGEYTFSDKNIVDSKGHSPKTKCYKYWEGMLSRCYNPNNKKHLSYINCTVCDEWHNYQNFAKWFYENYYEISNEEMCLDKDILNKGNNIYSPNNCCIVPATINKIFIKREKAKKFEMPIGITKTENKNKPTTYRAKIKKYSQYKQIGNYYTMKDAFNAYKIEKEKYIKEVADLYKDKIPKKVYDAMYNYKVEITD